MLICPRCAAHIPDEGAACPACGQAAQPAPRPGPAIQPEPNPPPAGDAEESDLARIPPRLAWHVRLLDVRAFPSPQTVKAVFLTTAIGSAAVGVIALLIGVASGFDVGPGCMLVIEAPLIGIFCVIGFAVAATVWQLLSHTVLYMVDPKRREAVRTLQRMVGGQKENQPPDDEGGGAPQDDHITAPVDEPDDRIAP